MSDAQAIMMQPERKGFRVHFEREVINPPNFSEPFNGAYNGTMYLLTADYFPDDGESLIETAGEAWQMAEAFAARAPKHYVHIYVVNEDNLPFGGRSTLRPLASWEQR